VNKNGSEIVSFYFPDGAEGLDERVLAKSAIESLFIIDITEI
jgi:hypothetical protein